MMMMMMTMMMTTMMMITILCNVKILKIEPQWEEDQQANCKPSVISYLNTNDAKTKQSCTVDKLWKLPILTCSRPDMDICIGDRRVLRLLGASSP